MPIFVSYSSQDEAVFSALNLSLESAGLDRWDSASMTPGDSLADQLQTAIGHCEVCIFIATRRSITSPWCLAELGAFWGAGKKVLMFMADPDLAESTLPPQFKGTLQVNNARTLIDSARKILMESQHTDASLISNEFFRSCGEYGTEQQWGELLDYSQSHFDSLGVTLSAWRRTPQFDKRALDRANSGCLFRFLLMHPENPLLEGVLYQGRDLKSVTPLILESIEYFGRLQTTHKNFEVRLIKVGLPHFSLVRTDKRLVLTQYVAAETWGAGPTWRCIEKSPLYEIAIGDFELLWREAVQIP